MSSVKGLTARDIALIEQRIQTNVENYIQPLAGILHVNTGFVGIGNGSQEAPFTKLQDAINAAVDFTTIYVTTKGDHAENITMRDLNGVAIIGSSEVNTAITNVGASHTFSWVPSAVTGATVHKFQLRDIEFINSDTTGTYYGIHIDANAITYPNTFCDVEFDLSTVDIEGAQTAGNPTAYFRNIGKAYWTHGDVVGGDLFVSNCSEFITRQVQVGTLVAPMNFQAEFNGNNPYNGLGRSNITVAQQSVVYGNLVLLGHPIFQMDTSSLVVGNVTGTLTSFYASGRDYCPLLMLMGQFGMLGGTGGAITLTFPDPQTSGSAFRFVDFSKAHIFGNLSLTKTNFLPATTRGYAVIQGQADFHTGTLTTSGYISLDLSNADYVHSNLIVGATSIVTRDSKEGVTVTASRAARPDDSGIVLRCNHATVAIAITVNVDAVTGFSLSEELTTYQAGAAAVTFAAGAGVTIRGTTGAAAQYKVTRLMRVGANEWAYA